jgi:hypothetical protein
LKAESARLHIFDSAFKLQYLWRPSHRWKKWPKKMKKYLVKSAFPVSLCLLISLDGWLPTASAQNTPAHIDVLVVEGEGSTGNIRQRVTRDPVVKVEDDDHRPVAGAAVVFALPVSGTTGEFANGTKTLAVITDKDGLAVASGLKTNEVPGKLQIYVTASYRGLRAKTLVNQFVVAAPGSKIQTAEARSSKSSGKWKWALLGAAAAAGAGAGVYFSNHGSSAPSPVSIGTGTVVFGSPR